MMFISSGGITKEGFFPLSSDRAVCLAVIMDCTSGRQEKRVSQNLFHSVSLPFGSFAIINKCPINIYTDVHVWLHAI